MRQVETGDLLVFDHIEAAGEMWAGTGRRRAEARVTFARPFAAPPVVLLTIRMIDGDARSNLRLELAPSEITAFGFLVTARTWSDTRIGRLAVSWLALGDPPPGEDGEMWEV